MNNKKLEELLELPSDSEDQVSIENTIVVNLAEELNTETLSNLEKIDNALPQVRSLEASDGEMDELADLATSSYKELMELGLSVEPKFSAEIFNSASSMLGHAITAKTAKINKKLKTIELQLKKAALDHKLAEKNEKVENTPLGEGQSLDRNELLKVLTNKNVEK